MVNLVINILVGFVFESIYFGYAYNKIKNVNYKSTYIIFLISYIFGAYFTNFFYSKIYIAYILCSIIFTIIYSIVHKERFEIINMFIILNILLISSILTAIPLIFIGYNNLSLLLNVIEIFVLILLVKIIPINKIYNLIVKNWNRTVKNKIKSVTIRNFSLISIYVFITWINIFLEMIFENIYQVIL